MIHGITSRRPLN